MNAPQKPILARRDAIESGENRYFTGAACKWGHVSERWTISGQCIACMNASKAGISKRILEKRAAKQAA